MTTQHITPKTIFLDALEITQAAERQAYIAAQCGGDETLRSKVEALLAHHKQLGSFLETGPTNHAATVDLPPLAEGRGSVIGPYKLLEQIGEGGMGVVFMAEQTRPVQRRVALKIIKAGMDTREVVARFEAERQALAMMDHPNIARVLDAGATETGRPYFVMELVRGVPMTEFCNQQSLSIRDRLALFVTVCQAVQHAHQKGIIHRDIKPTNVLVTLHDGRPVIKVIDFGVAKATGQKLTDKTLFTGFTQMIGTPLYMSPEQAEMTSQDIDTRSDIFSAGVLLYELLTGTTPFDSERLKNVAFDELRRIIREEEPPRPSTRLTTIAAQAASTVGTQRKSDARQLSRLFRGELDWIVMKCLEKDRTRRYETASALAGDVERYLHDEPVQACPPSARYRLGKFARRNKVALLTAGIVMLSLVGGMAGAIWGLVRADRALSAEAQQRQRADEQSELAFDTLRMVINEIQSKLEYVPGAQEVRRSLLSTALDGLKRAARSPATTARVDQASMISHRQLGEMFENLGDPKNGAGTEQAREQHQIALEIAIGLSRANPHNARAQADLAISYIKLGRVNETMRNKIAAGELCQKASETLQTLVQDDPEYGGLAFLYHELGALSLDLGKLAVAREAFQNALKTHQKRVQDNPANVHDQLNLAVSYHALAEAQRRLDEMSAAQDSYQKGLEICQRLAQNDPNSVELREHLSRFFGNKAEFDLQLGDLPAAHDAVQKAVKICRKLAEDDPKNAGVQYDLSTIYVKLGEIESRLSNVAAARDAFQKGLEISEKLARDDPQNLQFQQYLLVTCGRLGQEFVKLGNVAGARDADRKALEILQKRTQDNPNDTEAQGYLGIFYQRLGDVNLLMGNVPAARDAYQKNLEIAKKLGDGGELAIGYCTLGDVNSRLGNVSAAHDAYQKSLEICQKIAQEYPAARAQHRLGASYERLGQVSLQSGNLSDACADFRKELEIFRKLAEDDPKDPSRQRDLACPYSNLGHAEHMLGDVAAARDDYQKNLEILQKLALVDPKNVAAQTDLADSFGNLGYVEESAEDFPAGVRWYDQGVAILERLNKNGTIADQPDYQESLEEERQAMAVCRAAPQAIDSLEFALAQPKEIVPELLGIRARALAHRGKRQEAAETADKLASLEHAEGLDLFHAAVGFALCADGARAAQRQAKPSTDDKALEDRYAARAVELLKQAQAKGYFKNPIHRAALTRNSDLDLLQPRDDFQKLLAEGDASAHPALADPKQRGK